MSAIRIKRTVGLVAAGLIVAGLGWFAWQQPVAVDLATVGRAPMQVTVDDDESRTRVRDVYTVSAPIVGKVLRNPREVGDEVAADDTIVAVMQPMRPGFLDIRTREEVEASLEAAKAGVALAEHEVHRVQASLDYYRSELARIEKLKIGETISAKAMDEAKFKVETNEAALGTAKGQLEVRRNEVASLAARLVDPSEARSEESSCCIEIKAPVTGRVLKIYQESENIVQPGSPLIDIGDPRDLEVIADLLSTDAVQIKVGSEVLIDGWGGKPVKGRVVRIEPAGFLKISALGIEEQRVRTRIDFVDPPETWSNLGHDYRVIVHVTIWQGDKVLTVPVSALFRVGEEWAVYEVVDGVARTTIVKVDHRNDRVAEVVSGLSEGDQVILHPSDRISDGVSVAERPN